MLDKTRKTVRGRILLVQEERFRLLGEGGQAYLFTLSRKAAAEADDLEGWHEAGKPVMVEYEGEPNLESGVAHSVRPLYG